MHMDGLATEEVNDLPPVVRITAPNPGPKTLTGTHCYIVGGADACYIIDPGPDIEDYQRALEIFVKRSARRPLAIMLTHGHPDHAPGAARLAPMLGVPILASALLDTHYFATVPEFTVVADGDRFPIQGDTLVALTSPGHSEDHLAFWLETARILFAGDTILGQGTSLVAPPEGNMAEYMQTLERLRALDARLIAPGHGPIVTNPGAKIDEYVLHRLQREAQIVRALQRGPETVDNLVATIYVGIDPGLHELAAGSVLAQLAKLEEEGSVQRVGEQYCLSR